MVLFLCFPLLLMLQLPCTIDAKRPLTAAIPIPTVHTHNEHCQKDKSSLESQRRTNMGIVCLFGSMLITLARTALLKNTSQPIKSINSTNVYTYTTYSYSNNLHPLSSNT